MDKKIGDVDIDPFGEHELKPEEPTDERIPLDLVTPGREGISTWEQTCEQETSFGGRESQRTKLMKAYVKHLYKKLSETLVKPQNYFTMIILNLKVGNYTTQAIKSP